MEKAMGISFSVGMKSKVLVSEASSQFTINTGELTITSVWFQET
jgi:hypothetical protein